VVIGQRLPATGKQQSRDNQVIHEGREGQKKGKVGYENSLEIHDQLVYLDVTGNAAS